MLQVPESCDVEILPISSSSSSASPAVLSQDPAQHKADSDNTHSKILARVGHVPAYTLNNAAGPLCTLPRSDFPNNGQLVPEYGSNVCAASAVGRD